MKKFFLYTLIGLSIVAFSLMLLMLAPWLTIKQININDLYNLDKNEIIKTLNLDKDTNLLAFNSTSAKIQLKNNNYIENVEFKKIFPSTLNINIKEKEVYGYVPYVNNFIYLGKDGEVIDVKQNYKNALPLIEGLEFEEFIIGEKLDTKNKERLKVVVDFVNILYEKQILNKIQKINITNILDIHLYIGNIDVVIGDYQDLAIKVNTLSEILKKINTEEKGFLYIDDINSDPIFRYIT